MGRPVWTSTMLGIQLSLSTIILLFAISLASAKNYKCVTEDGEDCQCIFPFSYGGVSYTDCTDVDESNLWCATSLDDNGEYLDYGWCKERETGPEETSARPVPGASNLRLGSTRHPRNRSSGAIE